MNSKSFMNKLYNPMGKTQINTDLMVTTQSGYMLLFIRKSFFSLSLNFLKIMLELRLRLSYYFSELLSLFFILIIYLNRFNTNSTGHCLHNKDRK